MSMHTTSACASYHYMCNLRVHTELRFANEAYVSKPQKFLNRWCRWMRWELRGSRAKRNSQNKEKETCYAFFASTQTMHSRRDPFSKVLHCVGKKRQKWFSNFALNWISFVSSTTKHEFLKSLFEDPHRAKLSALLTTRIHFSVNINK